ncbi:DUF5933 domain-containing protein [Nocardia sp. JCM 34519.1]|uniref:phosphatase PAP2 family protein n=1 Tax=unclassified Nocardia TaxID=2637762 RepID=UPI0035A866F7
MDPGPGVGDVTREVRAPRSRIWLAAGIAAVPVLLIALQIASIGHDFEGPLGSLSNDYLGTPKSMSVPWAGLILALIGISMRRRLIALGVAVAIDVIAATVRLLAGGHFAIGNGPVWVLAGLALVAGFRWRGADRRNALHAAALGALLVLATKVGDVWLHITVVTRPAVFDEYAILADHALGDPSWVVARVLDALGPAVHAVLHWVYIELPVAAIVVAIWQLRRVVRDGIWPSHYLVRTFLVLGLVGPVLYLVFPVVGPMFAAGADGHGLQLGNYWPDVVPPIDRSPADMPFDGFTPRNCMPSMHTAWALSVFLHTRRDTDGGPAPLWLRALGTFWLIATLTATLGFGYHYGVDLVAGAVLCLTVESALREPERGWGWFRVRIVGLGATILAALLICYRYLAVPMAEYPVVAGTIVLALLAGLAAAFHATWFTHQTLPASTEPALADR